MESKLLLITPGSTANYAQKDKFFPDSEGVLQAAQTITHSDLNVFFEQYVAGTDEIPWNEFFKTVGLQLASEKVESADPGFTVARNFDSPLTVASVAENSAAERAGLAKGDVIVKINGRDPSGNGPSGKGPSDNFANAVAALHPGERIHIRIRNQRGEQELNWQLNTRSVLEFRLEDMKNLTLQQRARRAAWLIGDSEPIGQAHP